MKIVAFSVKNYRSLTRTHKISLKDYTVLIGPNNEGKSNLLRALVLGLSIIREPIVYYSPTYRRSRYRLRRSTSDIEYRWDIDFPIKLQKPDHSGTTDITLEFELSEDEKRDFRRFVKSSLRSNLKIRIILGARDYDLEVLLKVRAKSYISKRNRKITEFIRDRIGHQYIPSIRTAQMSTQLIEGMLEVAFSDLEEDGTYLKLTRQIEKMQRPILKSLGRRLTETVGTFIPDVKAIDLEIERGIRRALRTSCIVYVDDGTRTEIDFKGDGIKSLTAIALMRQGAVPRGKRANWVLAVEEPESHLHPRAIHQLSGVLREISHDVQVIITTHSPLLTNRTNIEQNIIVKSSRAKPAKRINEIRESLGVKISDNLSSAFLILLVEGTSDKIIARAILSDSSNQLASKLENGLIAIEEMNGVGKIMYFARLYKSLLSNIHLFLDYDKSAKSNVGNAIKDGFLEGREVSFATYPGMKESEIEDLIDPDIYKIKIAERFAVDLNCAEFRSNKSKWTVRMRSSFKRSAKLWDENIENNVKSLIADEVRVRGMTSLKRRADDTIEALKRSLLDYFI